MRRTGKEIGDGHERRTGCEITEIETGSGRTEAETGCSPSFAEKVTLVQAASGRNDYGICNVIEL